MSPDNDRSYHEARALAELQLAEAASDPTVAMVHRELAALHQLQLTPLAHRPDDVLQFPARSWSRR